ncbi:MAG: glycosyltransferase family A protein [Gemmatimonas sp.]
MSVIIPAYGRPDYLRAAIESVLEGGHDDTEVIVVDDGSPTPVELRIVDFIRDGRVRFFRKENGGAARARNFGAQQARGTFLMFLDDDDLAMPGSIGARARTLHAKPDVSVVFGNFSSFSTDSGVHTAANPLPEGLIDRWMMMERNHLISPGIALMRAEDFRTVGGFSATCPGSDDWDLFLRLSTIRPLWRMTDLALAYRVHDGNMSHRYGFMATGAMTVAERAEMLACGTHQPTAAYLANAYVDELYTGKLAKSIAAGRERKDSEAAARDQQVQNKLHAQLRRAKIRFRLRALFGSGQLRVRGGPLAHTGRHCHKCAAIRVHPDAV